MIAFGLLCGASVVLVWLGRRLGTGQRIVARLRATRQSLAAVFTFEQVSAEDDPLFALLSHTHFDGVDRHGSKLGSVLMRVDGAKIAALRVFTDESRTILFYVLCGWHGAQLSVESYTTDEEFHTWCGPRPRFARPPFIRRQQVKPARIGEVLDAHRAWIASESPGTLRQFTSIAEAIEVWLHIQERSRAWRNEQVPEDLAEQDLRAMLEPKQFETWWPRVRDKLGPDVPTARNVSKGNR